jgi:hypothetical protein
LSQNWGPVQAAFSGLHKSVKKALGDDAHYMAFSTVVLDLIRYAKVRPDPAIEMICDEDEEKACMTYGLYRRYKQRNMESRKALKSIAFADDVYYHPLQAADLFSWVSRAEALHRFFREAFRLRELYSEFNLHSADRRIDYTSGFWDKKSLEEFGHGTALALAKIRR